MVQVAGRERSTGPQAPGRVAAGQQSGRKTPHDERDRHVAAELRIEFRPSRQKGPEADYRGATPERVAKALLRSRQAVS